MSILTQSLTYHDLDHFPDDGKRREIIGGELFVSPAPLKQHQEAVARFYRLLYANAEATGWGKVYLSPVDVRFADGDQVQPDLIVIARERLHIYQGNTVFGAPDVVVEILSPSNRGYDLVEKARLYAENGVAEYWVADPTTPDFTMLALRDGRYIPVEPDADGRFHSTVVPGLVVDPVTLLANLDD